MRLISDTSLQSYWRVLIDVDCYYWFTSERSLRRVGKLSWFFLCSMLLHLPQIQSLRLNNEQRHLLKASDQVNRLPRCQAVSQNVSASKRTHFCRFCA